MPDSNERKSAPHVPAPRVVVARATPASDESKGLREKKLGTRRLTAYFAAHAAVRGVTLDFNEREVTAIIGPSGCGKSTLLRCLNRMHETVPTAHVEGNVVLNGNDIYAKGVSPIAVRRHIGMVFQRPTPFPTMSIRDNVAAGLRVKNDAPSSRRDIDDVVERALRRAALWEEVKDRLRTSAVGLSGGQQQRLCIARALATEPEVLLLDEPTASLDPLSTQRVEELVYELRRDVTVVIVTHNMQQAARVSDETAFMLAGELIELAPTAALFTTPRDQRTEAYITGRFG
ncbi:MAG TPA: phosphate ABC transporter ATP-binding protein PstB [Gemmatimonadaceae bacterium]|nr:phosphate ABC transporter ATP-binding protein PstB [Gemmatimonadaceae bacterium]